MVEGGDIVATGTGKLEEESKEEILDKPHSGNSSIREDSPTLDLNKASAVVEVDSDSSRLAIGASDGEPKDAIEFSTSVVQGGFDVVAGDDGATVAVREARREGGEGWDSNSLVETH